ncbi:hypothetical protein BX281_8260 [Streptomyces sp. Ag82_O1-15]|jgi:hypothetical protein|nr:hypothetical protein BX281_8260 [Streptomyces sp. Ag82_O1-15]
MSARRTPRHGDGGPARQPAAPDQEFARQPAVPDQGFICRPAEPDPEFTRQGRAPHPRRLPPGSRRPRIRALELPSRASHPQGGVV